MENKKTFREEVREELGLLSAIFMSQECKGTEIIMPSEKLSEILERICLYSFKETGEAVKRNKIKTQRTLQYLLWNPKNPKAHIWDNDCVCDGCQKNNEIQEFLTPASCPACGKSIVTKNATRE